MNQIFIRDIHTQVQLIKRKKQRLQIKTEIDNFSF
jgi:hypothetical protein